MVEIVPINDFTPESAESVMLTLEKTPGTYHLGDPWLAVLEIQDDD